VNLYIRRDHSSECARCDREWVALFFFVAGP